MNTSATNPSTVELQSLHRLFEQGQFALVERNAHKQLQRYPNSLILLNLLAMSQQSQGKLHQAADSFRSIVNIEPNIAEIHFNLGAIQTQLNDKTAAIDSYRKAVQLKPQLTIAHFNLGALLVQEGFVDQASKHYQNATQQQPNFREAWVNWGALLQEQGQLTQAEHCYRQALAITEDAHAYFNLGTSLHDQGKHQEAIAAFENALRLNPQFASAWNDLGELYRDQGNLRDAVQCYRQALVVDANHHRANYNIAESYALSGQLTQAINYFKRSDFADAHDRMLQCLYKTGQFDTFKYELEQMIAKQQHSSVLVGTLSTHYATNFATENPYRFCRYPMDFVEHTRIEELSIPNSPLLKELLDDVRELTITERKQGRLYAGVQSAGNLLLRPETSFQTLAHLLLTKVDCYRQRFAMREEGLIAYFPKKLEFASSWYLRMKKGGHLTSHIHEEGWISGCVYLQLPDKAEQHEGSFEYSIDGDDYPRLHDNFPRQIIDQKVGDLVLFPSSLFHRTIPFHAEQERICIAFDIKPFK